MDTDNAAAGRPGLLLDPIIPTLLLIDPLAGEPISGLAHATTATAPDIAAARHRAWGRQTCAIALDERVPLAAWQAPYVVELLGPQDFWIDEALSIATRERRCAQGDGLAGAGRAPHRIGAWLQSSARLPELVAHLSALMRVRTEFPAGKRYLRLADPRVFDLWRWQAGDAAVEAALHPVASWQYIDVAGAWATLGRRQADQAAPLPFLGAAPWRIMQRGSAIHDAVAKWFGELSLAGLPCPSPHSVYAQVVAMLDQACIAARRWPLRFQHDDDHTAWAALALLRPGLEDDERAHLALNEPATEGDPSARLHAIAANLAALCAEPRQATTATRARTPSIFPSFDQP